MRKQARVYHKAFVLHTEKFKKVLSKVDQWKRAMTSLANSVGWDVSDKYVLSYKSINKSYNLFLLSPM